MLCFRTISYYPTLVAKLYIVAIYRTWENFGELMALKSLARKNLANLLVVY